MAISRASKSSIAQGLPKQKYLWDKTSSANDIFKDGSTVAYYNFDGSSLVDSIGNFTLTASNVLYSPGKITGGLSAQFYGTSGGYVDVTSATLSGNSARSISMWVYNHSGNTGRQLLFGQGNFGTASSNNKNFDIEANVYDTAGASTRYGVHYWGDGIPFTNAEVIYDQWVHLVVVHDGGDINTTNTRMYINNVGGYLPTKTATFSITSGSNRVCMGLRYYRDASVPDLQATCKIDQLRVFNRAITAIEVSTLFNNGLGI